MSKDTERIEKPNQEPDLPEWGEYIDKGYLSLNGRTSPGTTALFSEIRRSMLPKHPETDRDNLMNAARQIFFEDDARVLDSSAKLNKLIQELYANIDLIKRGAPYLLIDLQTKAELYFKGFRWMLGHATPSQLRKKWVIIGPGPGRLIEAYWQLARIFRPDAIYFYEKDPTFYQELQKRVETLLGSSEECDGIKFHYREGDVMDYKLPKADVADSTWFGSSEVFDLTSAEVLRRMRLRYYRMIRNCIGNKGVYVEDIPDSHGANFYRYVRLITATILKELRIDELYTEWDHFGLSFVPSDNPQANKSLNAHIRYMPPNGVHDTEVRLGSLQHDDSDNPKSLEPIEVKSVVLPDPEGLYGSVNIPEIFRGIDTDNILKDPDKLLRVQMIISDRICRLLTSTKPSESTLMQKKVTLWGSNS